MSTSVWGIDHGDEVSKAFGPISFKPLLGAKPNKEVQNGLKMVQGMPKPQGVPKPPTNAVPGAKARQQFGGPASQQYGIKKNQEQVMGTSVWGVEHGPDEIAKSDRKHRKGTVAAGTYGGALIGGHIGREAGFRASGTTGRTFNQASQHRAFEGGVQNALSGDGLGGAGDAIKTAVKTGWAASRKTKGFKGGMAGSLAGTAAGGTLAFRALHGKKKTV
jgi:hypothetical protein